MKTVFLAPTPFRLDRMNAMNAYGSTGLRAIGIGKHEHDRYTCAAELCRHKSLSRPRSAPLSPRGSNRYL